MRTKDTGFPALTGIRAVAAFMVCLFHFNPFSEAIFGRYVHNFFNEFHTGVTVFFVLSGFLITYRYFDKEKIELKEYFVNRFARIYPVYFILTTFIMIVQGCKNDIPFNNFLVQYILNISLLRGFFDHYKFTGILQGWSLTVEEMFYFIAPFSFILIKRNKLFIVLLPLLLLFFGLTLLAIFHDKNFAGFFQNFEFVISFTFLGRATEFFVGIALALCFLKKARQTEVIEPQKGFTYTIIGILSIIFFIFWISMLKGDKAYGILNPYAKLINNLLLPIFGIAIFFWGLITELNWIQNFLSSKLMILLGKSSYVFYLIHLFVGTINDNLIFVFLVSTLFSIVFYFFIESPLNTFIKSKYLMFKIKHKIN